MSIKYYSSPDYKSIYSHSPRGILKDVFVGRGCMVHSLNPALRPIVSFGNLFCGFHFNGKKMTSFFIKNNKIQISKVYVGFSKQFKIMKRIADQYNDYEVAHILLMIKDMGIVYFDDEGYLRDFEQKLVNMDKVG